MVEKKINDIPYAGVYEWKTDSICRHLLYESCDLQGHLRNVGRVYESAKHKRKPWAYNFKDEEFRAHAGEILIEFYDILSKEMEVWPMFGTLLGILRSGDLIPHDDDLDFGYFKKDEHVLVSILDKIHGKDGYEIIRNEFSNLYSISKDDILIDLYEYEVIEGDPRLYQGHRRFYDLKQEEVFPLKELEFKGRKLKCIAEPEKFFERYYGSDWQVPK